MKSLVLGATSGVGRALSEDLCAEGSDLLIISSANEDLAALSIHLFLIYGVEVKYLEVDASSLESLEMLCQCVKSFGKLDKIFLPIGASSDGDSGILSSKMISDITNINFLFSVNFIESLLKLDLINPCSKIVGFGSIASIRGRKNNKIYSASKSALCSYFQSLAHQLFPDGYEVYFFKLGYINTQQTFGRTLLFSPAEAKNVSNFVRKKIQIGSGEFFYPRYWFLISCAIKIIPRFIFNKMDF
jgi:short-subunit dehydrogenase